MSAHVPQDLLQAFVAGEVDEQVAVHVALHLDSCPQCASRAAHAEPLFQAFASVDDPPIPSLLIEDVMGAVERDRRRRLPALEVGVGIALLLAAVVLVTLGSDPVGLIADSLSTLPRLGRIVVQGSASFLGLALALCLFLVGSTVALRRSLRGSP